jgi:hypothetical protein
VFTLVYKHCVDILVNIVFNTPIDSASPQSLGWTGRPVSRTTGSSGIQEAAVVQVSSALSPDGINNTNIKRPRKPHRWGSSRVRREAKTAKKRNGHARWNTGTALQTRGKTKAFTGAFWFLAAIAQWLSG